MTFKRSKNLLLPFAICTTLIDALRHNKHICSLILHLFLQLAACMKVPGPGQPGIILGLPLSWRQKESFLCFSEGNQALVVAGHLQPEGLL